jgi:hypothetical protein
MSQEELNSKIWEFIHRRRYEMRMKRVFADAHIERGVMLLARHINPGPVHTKARIGNVVFDSNAEDERVYQAKLVVISLIDRELRNGA